MPKTFSPKSSKKNVRILLIAAVIIIAVTAVFAYFPGQVKVHINFTPEFESEFYPDMEHAVLTNVDDNYTVAVSNRSATLTGRKKADYGYYIFSVPVTVRKTGEKAVLNFAYVKPNNYYRAKIEIEADFPQGDDFEVKATASLKERGRLQKKENVAQGKALIDKNKKDGEYLILTVEG